MNLVLITLNCWGLWLVAKHRSERLRYIGEFLQGSAADVVLLQEVWVRQDVEEVSRRASQGGLTHSVRAFTGMFGGELLLLSRFPVTKVVFQKFGVAGNPSAVFQGDYFAAKGMSYAQLQTPEGPVDMFSTHLGANYLHNYAGEAAGVAAYSVPDDPDGPVRVAQMLQLVEFITSHQHQDAIATIVGGDFNAHPQTLELELFRTSLPQLQDSWQVARPEDPGYTVNDPGNTFAMAKRVKDPPLRIDYLWTSRNVTVERAQLIMQTTSAGYSFSDHFGLRVEVDVRPDATEPGPSSGRSAAAPQQDVMTAAAQPYRDALSLLHTGGQRYELSKRRFIQLSAFLLFCLLPLALALLVLSSVQGWGRSMQRRPPDAIAYSGLCSSPAGAGDDPERPIFRRTMSLGSGSFEVEGPADDSPCNSVASGARSVDRFVLACWVASVALFGLVCAGAPVCFILGFAGYGPQANALHNAEQQLQIALAGQGLTS